MVVRMMPYEEFAVYLEEKCGYYFQGLYYKVPSQDLERGLVRASDDRSLSYMFDVEETFGPPKKRYCNDFTLHEMVDWAKMEVQNQEGVETSTRIIDKGIDATDGVEARTCTTNKGKEKVSEDAIEVVQTRRSTVENDIETEYDNDDDSDYQSDKSVDYLSPGEEELIQLRNRINANREAKVKAKENPVLEMSKPNNENSIGNGYPRKRQKSKPKRQNRAREQKESKEKSKIKAKSKIQVNKSQVKVNPEMRHWKEHQKPKPKT
ncbi:hypothetical protein Tco_0494340 [Tanacetum coccineum]